MPANSKWLIKLLLTGLHSTTRADWTWLDLWLKLKMTSYNSADGGNENDSSKVHSESDLKFTTKMLPSPPPLLNSNRR